MVEAFRSSLAIDSRRIQTKLLKRAETKPLETVTLLLRNYDHEERPVHDGVKKVLKELIKKDTGMDAILIDMVHPSRNVRKAVQNFMGEAIGAHAITYASFYEQTMLLVAMSKRKEIPVDDIMSLAELSKRTFKEGEVMEAVKDIGFCLDFVKHRYKSSEQLREYVADLLKMAPDLSRMGVYSSSIEEPLRKAMVASRYRDYNETGEIIQERVRESKMRSDLHSIGRLVSKSIYDRPAIRKEHLSDREQEVLVDLHVLVDQVTSLVLAGKRNEATEILLVFEEQFLSSYETEWSERVKAKDPVAQFILYSTGLICVKLASSIIAASAEDIYQAELRPLEEEPSIHLVMWPEAVMGNVSVIVGQSSDNGSVKA